MSGWSKPSASNLNGECVEVAITEDEVLVRDSKDPDGPVLAFTVPEWRAFVAGCKGGEFDIDESEREATR